MDRQIILGIIMLQVTAFTLGTDFTGALFLVPPIENEFSADITTAQWVLNMYALTFAAGMIAGGRFERRLLAGALLGAGRRFRRGFDQRASVEDGA